MNRLLLLLFVCCGFAPPIRGADFDAANRLYDEGKFHEAKAAYQQLVEVGKWSANLFYNLGNAHHRLGAPGEAVLAYERALALDPSHPEARANLNFVRGETGAVPWPESWADRVFPGRWSDAYAIAGALAGWLVAFALARIFLTPAGDKSALWFGAVMAAAVAGYSAAAVWHLEQERALAIVTAKSVEAHLAPAESSAPGGVLAAGSEVRVLSERGDWTYCSLAGQNRGWISSKALSRVRLGEL